MRRTVDIVVAIVAIVAIVVMVVVAPAAAIVGILMLTSRGRPVLFRQRRIGRGGELFTLVKFRTMRPAKWPGEPDNQRTPRLGALLRASSLNELPQLWNILRGDMSFIGPRPTLPEQVEHYTHRQRGRLAIRPGLTRWAQVNGRNSISWPERIELNLWYIEHRSAPLHTKILLRTAARLVKPLGVTGAAGSTPPFPSSAGRTDGAPGDGGHCGSSGNWRCASVGEPRGTRRLELVGVHARSGAGTAGPPLAVREGTTRSPVLMYCCEASLLFVSRNRSRLQEVFRFRRAAGRDR